MLIFSRIANPAPDLDRHFGVISGIGREMVRKSPLASLATGGATDSVLSVGRRVSRDSGSRG